MQPKAPAEQSREIRRRKQYDEQLFLSQTGTSTAFEDGRLVTIGLNDCHFESFKEFCVTQMAKIGMEGYCQKVGGCLDDLVYDLSQLEDDDERWKEDVLDYFDGMEADT